MNFPSVVIVGRGASLLKKELGNLIDSFDVVIRINHTSKNLQKHVGTKTTIFSSRVIFKMEEFLDEIIKAKKLWICDQNSNLYDEFLKTINGVEVTFMSDDETGELKKHFVGYGDVVKPNDARFDVCMPDTGITTIFSALRRFENSKICVCGIDLYNGGNKNIFGVLDISSIFKTPVLLQTLYYKKLVYAGKIQEI